jgi:hypothetical protein
VSCSQKAARLCRSSYLRRSTSVIPRFKSATFRYVALGGRVGLPLQVNRPGAGEPGPCAATPRYRPRRPRR